MLPYHQGFLSIIYHHKHVHQAFDHYRIQMIPGFPLKEKVELVQK